ncbi:MAG: hypothetical protein ACJ72U_13035 [Nitrososphaeraceae archaeon]
MVNVKERFHTKTGKIDTISVRELNKEKVLQFIIRHPEGVYPYEIVDGIDVYPKLTRQTIHNCLRELLSEKRIYQKKENGKYFIYIGDIALRAYWLNHRAMENFWKMAAHKNNPFCKIDLRNSHEDYLDRESLFVFANTIGAYITYVMIEATHPNENAPNLEGADGSKEFFFNGSHKDDIARRWIEESINPQLILREFEELHCVKRGLRNYTDIADPLDPSFSFHEMDKDNFRKLREAFAKTFPDVFKKLEDIRKGLRYQINEDNRQFRKWKKELSKNKEMQKMYDSSHLVKSGKEVVKCDGVMNIIRIDKKGNKHRKCSKCGRIAATPY